MPYLTGLPDELLGLVATALDDPQADAQNTCRLAASSKAMQRVRQRDCGSSAASGTRNADGAAAARA